MFFHEVTRQTNKFQITNSLIKYEMEILNIHNFLSFDTEQ